MVKTALPEAFFRNLESDLRDAGSRKWPTDTDLTMQEATVAMTENDFAPKQAPFDPNKPYLKQDFNGTTIHIDGVMATQNDVTRVIDLLTAMRTLVPASV